MIDLPMKAFCLMGSDGENKIEMTIDEIFGFPETTDYEGGYAFEGTLIIHVGCYKVHSKNYISTTGVLCRFYDSLIKCYDSLEGIAKYTRMHDIALEFELVMTKNGHATIDGKYIEYPHLSNKLTFEIETDQSCIRCAIDDLSRVESLFGDANDKCIR